MLQIIMAVLAVIADQWLKHWVVMNIEPGTVQKLIPGIIHLTYVQNDGAALSLFSGMRWVLFAVSAVFVLVALWFLITKRIKNPLGSWSLAAIVAGAAGNAVDRALSGYVVDMFAFEIVLDFFVFNIADVFITFGGVLFCIYFLTHYKKSEELCKWEVPDEKDDR